MKINTNNFKKYRKKAVLSQADIANRLNISRCIINEYENGKRGAQPKRIKELAEILDCPPDKLVL